MSRIAVTAVILAGGKSSRMGQDKALLRFGQCSVVEHLAAILASLFDETLIVVNDRAKLWGLTLHGARVVEDVVKGCGPLAGVYTALLEADHEACCVLTCDMPFVDDILIREFQRAWDPAVDALCLLNPQGELDPFPGIYHARSHILMGSLLDAREYAMRRFLDRSRVKSLSLEPARARVLANMNTPEDYHSILRDSAGAER